MKNELKSITFIHEIHYVPIQKLYGTFSMLYGRLILGKSMNRSGFISVAISYIDWTITIFRFKVIQEVYADDEGVLNSRYWSHSRHHGDHTCKGTLQKETTTAKDI